MTTSVLAEEQQPKSLERFQFSLLRVACVARRANMRGLTDCFGVARTFFYPGEYFEEH